MENTENKIQFNIHSFKVHEFAVLGTAYNQEVDVTISTNIDIIADPENRRVGFLLGFEFFQSEKLLLKLKTGCYIEFEENSWKTSVKIGEKIGEGNLVMLPDKILKYFINFTINTSRGILIAKTEGTLFASLTLPIVDTDEIATAMQNRADELFLQSKESEPKLKKQSKKNKRRNDNEHSS